MKMRRTIRTIALLPPLLAATVVTPAAQSAALAAPAFTPGSSGIGDPYYPLDGNGGYDAVHYDLAIEYHPITDVLSGVATISANAKQALSRFNLDFDGLTIRSMTVNGEPAKWSRARGELTVTPSAGIPDGAGFRTVVTYDGVPELLADGTGVIPTDDGAMIQGAPHVASLWFPVNDHPSDKASYTVHATVPAGVEAIGNGSLLSRTESAGKTTWTWDEPDPMASYLATVSIGQFEVSTYTRAGLRYWDAIDPDLLQQDIGDDIQASLARQPDIIKFLSTQFGPYPFATAGGVVDDLDSGIAMENQTRPVYAPGWWADGQNDVIVVHEIAHQWYGDSVSIARWQDIWLNEGFANYAEWLWDESEGLGTADETFDYFYNDFVPFDPNFWNYTIGDPGADNQFVGAIYRRGAMTLHVLRRTVGDDPFFTIMRDWVSHRGGGNGTTEQFIALSEQVSGQQLDTLFDAWLYTPGKPALSASFARTTGADRTPPT